MEWSADEAEECARDLMSGLGRRQEHVRRVAALADVVAEAVGISRELLVAAAWVHDIGYSADLADTGFHPLDGGRFLRSQGCEQLALLAAHHSGARNEAVLRGIDGYCDEFPFDNSIAYRALTYCDLTTGPEGSRVGLEQRMAEIQDRYGAGHVVARAILAGKAEFTDIRDEIDAELERVGYPITGALAYPQTSSR